MTLAANIPDAGGIARLRYQAGLQGSGQPVAITITQTGETRIPTLVEMEVALVPVSGDPPRVEGVQPGDVLPDELTFVWVTGNNFTRDTRITFPGAGDLVDPFALIDEATGIAEVIGGYTPILPPGDPESPVGWKNVVASDARGATTAENAFYYVDFGRPYLKYLLDPTEIPPEGGTRLTFFGRNFREGLEPRVDNVPCTDVTFIDDTLLECTAPDLPFDPEVPTRAAACQIHDAATSELLSERYVGIFITSGAKPPLILAVEPTEANARGGTPISIHGQNFREDTEVVIGDILSLEDRQLVSSQLITGIATGVDPLNPRTPPGLNDILVYDRRGSSSIHFAINYVDKIRSVSPLQLSAAGGEAVAFDGFGFEEGLTPRLGGEALLGVDLASTEHIEGTSPPLAPGFHDATLTDDGGAIVGYLPYAVEVTPGGDPVSPVITSVTPGSIPEGQSLEIFFEGVRFFAGLTPRLGGVPLLGATFVDAGHFVEGAAPPAPGPDVCGEDPTRDALTCEATSPGC